MASPPAPTADLTTVLLESAVCLKGKMGRPKEAVSSVPLAAHHSDALFTHGSRGVVRALPVCCCLTAAGGFS